MFFLFIFIYHEILLPPSKDIPITKLSRNHILYSSSYQTLEIFDRSGNPVSGFSLSECIDCGFNSRISDITPFISKKQDQYILLTTVGNLTTSVNSVPVHRVILLSKSGQIIETIRSPRNQKNLYFRKIFQRANGSLILAEPNNCITQEELETVRRKWSKALPFNLSYFAQDSARRKAPEKITCSFLCNFDLSRYNSPPVLACQREENHNSTCMAVYEADLDLDSFTLSKKGPHHNLYFTQDEYRHVNFAENNSQVWFHKSLDSKSITSFTTGEKASLNIQSTHIISETITEYTRIVLEEVTFYKGSIWAVYLKNSHTSTSFTRGYISYLAQLSKNKTTLTEQKITGTFVQFAENKAWFLRKSLDGWILYDLALE